MAEPKSYFTSSDPTNLEQLDQMLKEGNLHAAEDWLRSRTFSVGVLSEAICRIVRYRLAAEPQVAARDYLQQFPAIFYEPNHVLKILVSEFDDRQVLYPEFSEEDFLRLYPYLKSLPGWEHFFGHISAVHAKQTVPENGQSTYAEVNRSDMHSISWLLQRLLPSPHIGDLGLYGDFRILNVIGRGGMGIVVRGMDQRLKREVAIKLVRPEIALDPKARKRFFREARAVAELEHPRIVTIHQVGEWDGIPFLIMPLLKGQSLRDRLNLPIPLDVHQLQIWIRELLEGLAFIHSRGLIHRDIKPENIWLEEGYDGTHIRWLDFGLVRSEQDQTITEQGAIVGTVAYMSPEQTDGQPSTPRSDLFSIGAVIYEMLTRQPAFQRSTSMSTMYAVNHTALLDPSEISSDIPKELGRWCLKLLEKQPKDRYFSAIAALAQLPVDSLTSTPAYRDVVQTLQPTVDYVRPQVEKPNRSSWFGRVWSKLRGS